MEIKFIDDLYPGRVRLTDHCPSLRAGRTGVKTIERISTNGGGISSTVRATYYKNGARNIIKNITEKQGYEGVIEIEKEEYRIRKLTPMECWNLMAFSQEDYIAARIGDREKAKELIAEYEPDRHLELMQLVESKAMTNVSSTQLYKQAGNSIVVDVLYYIYKQLYKAMPYLFDDLKVSSYFPVLVHLRRDLINCTQILTANINYTQTAIYS